jgi:acyl-homoserine-lactone acylase
LLPFESNSYILVSPFFHKAATIATNRIRSPRFCNPTAVDSTEEMAYYLAFRHLTIPGPTDTAAWVPETGMDPMKRLVTCVALLSLVLPFTASSSLSSKAVADGEATIYRDEYGIPHVYARTLPAAAYAVGYAQAEDRLEELLKNYRRAAGTMSEVFGPANLQEDLIMRTLDNEGISKQKYNEVSSKMRAVIEAYQDGIKQFMKEHPEQVPSWAQEIHPWDVVALGRYIIFGWPIGEALEDLRRGHISLTPPPYHGSNEMLIAPSRTAMHAPIAVIDPHLSWYDQFRFYEVRIYGGDFAVSGVAILGVPIPALGHSRFCSVAMTTGGPDTSDIYEEEINPANPHQYKYDGQWREMTVREEKFGVKNGDTVKWQTAEFDATLHGPIVARHGNKAYAAAIPYQDQVGLTDQSYEMMTAHNLDEMKTALSHLQLMAQNIMVGTVQGDIFYVRNGRVPIRAKGVDPNLPIAGNTSATRPLGIHPFSDLVQITNPASGYMHNCNVTPAGMMKDSPLVPEKYSRYPYIYNATREAPRHQRAYEMTDLLDAAGHVTLEQAVDIAFNPTVWHADLWQARLKEAWAKAPDSARAGDAVEVYELVQKWNRRSDADSEGALAYYAFKKGLDAPTARMTDPPASIKDEDLVEALHKAAIWLKDNFASLHVPYGQYFRVGRQGGAQTWPVGGGSLSDVAMATPRAINFAPVGSVMVGGGGQTSTQIVVLTNPPKSYAIIPLGESDHKDSGHWDDQAQKLFSKSIAAPTYFLDRSALMKHVTRTEVLKYTAPLAAAGN